MIDEARIRTGLSITESLLWFLNFENAVSLFTSSGLPPWYCMTERDPTSIRKLITLLHCYIACIHHPFNCVQDRFEHAKRIVCTVGGACGMVADSRNARIPTSPQFHSKFYSRSAGDVVWLSHWWHCVVLTFHSKNCSKDDFLKGHMGHMGHISGLYVWGDHFLFLAGGGWASTWVRFVGSEDSDQSIPDLCLAKWICLCAAEVTFRAFAGTALCALVSRALLNMCGTSTKAWLSACWQCAMRWLDSVEKNIKFPVFGPGLCDLWVESAADWLELVQPACLRLSRTTTYDMLEHVVTCCSWCLECPGEMCLSSFYSQWPQRVVYRFSGIWPWSISSTFFCPSTPSDSFRFLSSLGSMSCQHSSL